MLPARSHRLRVPFPRLLRSATAAAPAFGRARQQGLRLEPRVTASDGWEHLTAHHPPLAEQGKLLNSFLVTPLVTPFTCPQA
eukprot:7549710-Pyramimonas_sp.AAC.1